MALSMKERYSRLDLSKLPQEYKDQFDVISSNTDGFTDEDLIPLFQENFDTLYELVEQRFPDVIKKAGKVIKEKPAKVKVVRKKKAKLPTEKDFELPGKIEDEIKGRKKLSEDEIEFIEDQLRNNEESTDEELAALFVSEIGISNAIAKRWVKLRDKYLRASMEDSMKYSERKKLKKQKRSDENPNIVETLDGYKFNRKDPDLKGKVFYDVKGKQWTCKGYNKQLDSCIMISEDGKEVASCLKDMYLNNPKEKMGKGNLIDDCKETLKEAGYSVKTHKAGNKVIKRRKPRPEKEIIKERVSDTFTPITKDLESSDEKKAENKEILSVLKSIEGKLSKLLNRLSNLADDGKTEKLEKLDRLLSELLGE